MLVKELIAELQKLDQDAPVYTWNQEFSEPVNIRGTPWKSAKTKNFSGFYMLPGYVIG